MFGFLTACSAQERMNALERFIEFWYGPRKPEYGESEGRLQPLRLPYPLRCFYAFAGRWPFPKPTVINDDSFFYSGEAADHLYTLDHIKLRSDGRLEFFGEYTGFWTC